MLTKTAVYAPPRHNYSALILDDHSGMRRVVARTFSKLSIGSEEGTSREPTWRVETAESFGEAMEKLSPDIGIALVDIHLGDDLPDGIDFVKEARAIGYLGFVCMLTASEDRETLSRALIAGADDYVLKSPDSVSDDLFRYVIARASGRLVPGAGLDPRIHGRYLVSRGVHDNEVPTVCEFHNRGYPDDKILGAALGMERGTVRQRLNRARERLGLENRYQLVSLLTVLSGYGARYRTAGRGEG